MVNTNGGEGRVGASKITSEVTNIIAQVPPVIEAMTGIKLTDLWNYSRAPKSVKKESVTALIASLYVRSGRLDRK